MIRIFRKINDIFKNILGDEGLVYIVEDANWSIKWDGIQITNSLNTQNLIKSCVRTTSIGLKNKIIHFGSVGTLIDSSRGIKKIHKSNKVILTWFHVAEDDERVRFIPDLNIVANIIHTSCEKTKKTLISKGITENKIIVIPLGVNLNLFKKYSKIERQKIKQSIGLPQDKIIIGSFQKDGNGWGEGLEPKLIKGPDVFCDVVTKLSKIYNIHVLLTGPSRGYVKKRLEKENISFTHFYLEKYHEIVKFYNCLDIYIIASRVEGGPKAILESWATGVPVVSTKVGMVPDIAKDVEDVLLAEVGDVENIFNSTKKIIENKKTKEIIIFSGLKKVGKYTWDEIAKNYYSKIYSIIK